MSQKIEITIENRDPSQSILKQEITAGTFEGLGHARLGLLLGSPHLYVQTNNGIYTILIDQLIKPILEAEHVQKT